MVVILVFAAGIFTGLFTNSGMSDALANSLITLIPPSLGRFWGLITAIVSAPGTFLLSNDAFYYGVLLENYVRYVLLGLPRAS